MGNLFGKSKSSKKPPSRVTEEDRVVLQMKVQRDKLKQYKRQLEMRLERERQVASRLVKEGKRDRALIILRKKKYMEKMIEKTENNLETMERLTQDVEWAQIEVNVVKNLEEGNAALKSLTDLMNLDDIEKMLDETREASEVQKEITDMIIGIAPELDVDDSTLMSELEELIGTKEQEDTVPSLPDVPSDEVTAPAGDEPVFPKKSRTENVSEPQLVPA